MGTEDSASGAVNDVATDLSVSLKKIHGLFAEGRMAEVLEMCNELLPLAIERGDTLAQGRVHDQLGLLYRESGDFPTAIDHFERALALFGEAGALGQAANATCHIGGTYFYLESYEDALSWLERGIAMQREAGNRSNAVSQTSGMAKVFINAGRAEEGLALLHKAYAEALDLGDPSIIAVTTLDMARSYVLEAKYADALVMLRKHSALLESKWSTAIDRETLIAISLANSGEYAECIPILQAALDRATEVGSRAHMENIHRILREVAKETGDFEGYIHHNNEYQRINDEIRGASAARKLAMMESEKKVAALTQEREKERAILYSALPRAIADRMVRGETVSDVYEDAAVLFTDIVGFTRHSSKMSAQEVSAFLESLYRAFDQICKQHDVVKVKTIGDSYLCFKGDGTSSANAEAVASVALAMQGADVSWPSGEPLSMRIGLHIGSVSAGVIGTERLQYDIWGDTVNTASRMESTGEPGRIQVTEAFKENLAPRAWSWMLRGETSIKGKGTVSTYWLEGA